MSQCSDLSCALDPVSIGGMESPDSNEEDFMDEQERWLRNSAAIRIQHPYLSANLTVSRELLSHLFAEGVIDMAEMNRIQYMADDVRGDKTDVLLSIIYTRAKSSFQPLCNFLSEHSELPHNHDLASALRQTFHSISKEHPFMTKTTEESRRNSSASQTSGRGKSSVPKDWNGRKENKTGWEDNISTPVSVSAVSVGSLRSVPEVCLDLEAPDNGKDKLIAKENTSEIQDQSTSDQSLSRATSSPLSVQASQHDEQGGVLDSCGIQAIAVPVGSHGNVPEDLLLPPDHEVITKVNVSSKEDQGTRDQPLAHATPSSSKSAAGAAKADSPVTTHVASHVNRGTRHVANARSGSGIRLAAHHNRRSLHFVEKQYTLKIGVLGDSSVGKTQFIRSTENPPPRTKATIGWDMATLALTLDDEWLINLILYDTAGTERYNKSLLTSVYRKCDGFVLMFDVTTRSTLKSLQKWLKLAKEVTRDDNVPSLVFANKTDLVGGRQVEDDDAKRWCATKLNTDMYHSGSAKHNDALDFMTSMETLIRRIMEVLNWRPDVPAVSETESERRGCAC